MVLETQKNTLERAKIFNQTINTLKFCHKMSEETSKDVNLDNYKLIEGLFLYEKEEKVDEKKESDDDEKKIDEFKKKEAEIIKKNNLTIQFNNIGTNWEELDELEDKINNFKNDQNKISEYIQNKNKENSAYSINDDNKDKILD